MFFDEQLSEDLSELLHDIFPDRCIFGKSAAWGDRKVLGCSIIPEPGKKILVLMPCSAAPVTAKDDAAPCPETSSNPVADFSMAEER